MEISKLLFLPVLIFATPALAKGGKIRPVGIKQLDSSIDQYKKSHISAEAGEDTFAHMATNDNGKTGVIKVRDATSGELKRYDYKPYPIEADVKNSVMTLEKEGDYLEVGLSREFKDGGFLTENVTIKKIDGDLIKVQQLEEFQSKQIIAKTKLAGPRKLETEIHYLHEGKYKNIIDLDDKVKGVITSFHVSADGTQMTVYSKRNDYFYEYQVDIKQERILSSKRLNYVEVMGKNFKVNDSSVPLVRVDSNKPARNIEILGNR